MTVGGRFFDLALVQHRQKGEQGEHLERVRVGVRVRVRVRVIGLGL